MPLVCYAQTVPAAALAGSQHSSKCSYSAVSSPCMCVFFSFILYLFHETVCSLCAVQLITLENVSARLAFIISIMVG